MTRLIQALLLLVAYAVLRVWEDMGPPVDDVPSLKTEIAAFLNAKLSIFRCQYCGAWGWFKTRSRNTAYEPPSSPQNYIRCCDQCYEEDCEQWKERWEEYYRGVL